MKIEYRAFPFLEVRVDGDGQPKVVGHAAVFNSLSEDLGGFREKIAPGAFTKTLKEADVRFLINHDGLPLARTKSGTLDLKEDDRGLRIEAALEPEDPDVQRLLPKMQRGDLDQMSFAFRAIVDEWDTSKTPQVRTLKEVSLFDVSIVTFPAYPRTSVKVRSIMTEAGIDFDALAGIMARVDHGLAISGDDTDIIDASLEVLRRYIPAEPSQGAHSDGGAGGELRQGPPLSLLWRRLELASRT